MESGGENPGGMAQSLCDLNDCIAMLKETGRLDGAELSVMGHSWGGFSTLNIAALHPEVSRVAVLSGFVSVPLLIRSFFSGILRGYRRAVMELERESNPVFVEYDAVESLRASETKALLIYSDNDPLCRREVHYDALCRGLANRANTEMMLVPHKGHNPNYTEDAVRYLSQYSAARTKLLKKSPSEEKKKEFVQSWDWDRMTAQDGKVWEKIFAFLDD
jgi:dipeptidyl aminopeptidase/acylaminoacyl peptidase